MLASVLLLTCLGAPCAARDSGQLRAAICTMRETRERQHAEEIALARLLWGECRGCVRDEQAKVAWVVCNRVDAWGGTVLGQITAPGQFAGYSPQNPIDPALLEVARDVLRRWRAGEETGREISREYLYFSGDGVRNYFRATY